MRLSAESRYASFAEVSERVVTHDAAAKKHATSNIRNGFLCSMGCSLLEHFQKYCSHAVLKGWGSGLFGFGLRFGSVTGHEWHAPLPKPRPNPKILAPRGYSIFSNALTCLTSDHFGLGDL